MFHIVQNEAVPPVSQMVAKSPDANAIASDADSEEVRPKGQICEALTWHGGCFVGQSL